MDEGEGSDLNKGTGNPDNSLSQSLGLVPRNDVAPLRVIRDYSIELVEQITDYFISGYSMKDISLLQGMPSTSTMLRWLKQFPEFQKRMTEAREIRGLALEDRLANLINPNIHKDDVPAHRLAFDQLAWLAEKNNPKVFGKKVEVGGGGAPIQIVVNTGVPTPLSKIEKIVEEAAKDLTNTISIEELKAEGPEDDGPTAA